MPLWIRYQVGDQMREFDLGQRLKVGRSKECEISLPHDGMVSGSHCVLQNGKLCDAKSTNGTELNGQPVKQGSSIWHELKHGDVILVGQTRLVVYDPDLDDEDVDTEIAPEQSDSPNEDDDDDVVITGSSSGPVGVRFAASSAPEPEQDDSIPSSLAVTAPLILDELFASRETDTEEVAQLRRHLVELQNANRALQQRISHLSKSALVTTSRMKQSHQTKVREFESLQERCEGLEHQLLYESNRASDEFEQRLSEQLQRYNDLVQQYQVSQESNQLLGQQLSQSLDRIHSLEAELQVAQRQSVTAESLCQATAPLVAELALLKSMVSDLQQQQQEPPSSAASSSLPQSPPVDLSPISKSLSNLRNDLIYHQQLQSSRSTLTAIAALVACL